MKNIRVSVSATNPNDLSPPPSFNNSDNEQEARVMLKKRQIAILARARASRHQQECQDSTSEKQNLNAEFSSESDC